MFYYFCQYTVEKTTLFHSTRDILRGKFRKAKSLETEITSSRNGEWRSISEFIGPERKNLNLYKFCAKGYKLGELSAADTLSRSWRLFLAEVHTDLQCSASYQDRNMLFLLSCILSFHSAAEYWFQHHVVWWKERWQSLRTAIVSIL